VAVQPKADEVRSHGNKASDLELAAFFAGTLAVATESGQKLIETVRAGERVWSCDF